MTIMKFEVVNLSRLISSLIRLLSEETKSSIKMLIMMVFIQSLLILFKVQLELNLNGIMRVIINTGPFVKLRLTQILDLG